MRLPMDGSSGLRTARECSASIKRLTVATASARTAAEDASEECLVMISPSKRRISDVGRASQKATKILPAAFDPATLILGAGSRNSAIRASTVFPTTASVLSSPSSGSRRGKVSARTGVALSLTMGLAADRARHRMGPYIRCSSLSTSGDFLARWRGDRTVRTDLASLASARCRHDTIRSWRACSSMAVRISSSSSESFHERR
mmetsp:Transcript_32112/g.70596  ORF Transcript_32112/g.70596 Transcript_32112/m.70596 type:complete len:203 (+) Transcript_32112:769-1377(+)